MRGERLRPSDNPLLSRLMFRRREQMLTSAVNKRAARDGGLTEKKDVSVGPEASLEKARRFVK